jgi:hypothetical protein
MKAHRKRVSKDYALTKKGRRFMREERYLKTLSEHERMAYVACRTLIPLVGKNSSIEEAMEGLE